MTNTPTPDSKLDDIRELLIDFGLPLVILIILTILLVTGIDGEVKTLFAAVVGWIIKGGIARAKAAKGG